MKKTKMDDAMCEEYACEEDLIEEFSWRDLKDKASTLANLKERKGDDE